MPNTLDQKIIVNGTPVAWAYVIEKNGTTGKYEIPSILGSDASKQFRFDNVADINVTMTRPAAVAGATADEFIQVTRADGTIIEFLKSKLTLDGATGSVKGGSGVTSEGGSGGTITFNVNAADIDSAHWIAFVQKCQALLGSTFLVCVPLGYNHIRRKAGATSGDPNAVGFAYMIGTLSADLTQAISAYTPVKINFQFASKALAIVGADLTDPHAAVDFGDNTHKILVPTGISAGTPTGEYVTPGSITVHTSGTISADFQKLLDGEVLFTIGD